MSTSDQHDRRREERRAVRRTAVLSVDGHQTVLETRDLSKGGAYLTRGGDAPLPAEGSEVFVNIAPSDPSEEPMIVRAKVVHVGADGFGVLFLE